MAFTRTFQYTAQIATSLGEVNVIKMLVDKANGVAYAAVSGGTLAGQADVSKLIKIRLSDFTRIATLTLSANRLADAAIDLELQEIYTYHRTLSLPTTPKVLKVNLSTFTVTGTISLPANVDFGFAGDVPVENTRGVLAAVKVGTYHYLTGHYSNATNGAGGQGAVVPQKTLFKIVTEDPVTPANNFTISTYGNYGGTAISGVLIGGPGTAAGFSSNCFSTGIDYENGHAYYMAVGSPDGGVTNVTAVMLKINVSDMSLIDHVFLSAAADLTPNSVAYDSVRDLAFAGTSTSLLFKIDASTMTILESFNVATLTGQTVNGVISVSVDTLNGYVYMGGGTGVDLIFQQNISSDAFAFDDISASGGNSNSTINKGNQLDLSVGFGYFSSNKNGTGADARDYITKFELEGTFGSTPVSGGPNVKRRPYPYNAGQISPSGW